MTNKLSTRKTPKKIEAVSSKKLTQFKLSIEEAKVRAEPYKFIEGKPTPSFDPKMDIKPSLLSADHIIEYVNQTGMIAPFDASGGEDSRLKAASYEGRIGNKAYIFDDGNNAPTQVLEPDAKSLVVPANSIVFVECDLEFRLPSFIGVRFNLQIIHVHRGLLLGTGPLVDPLFRGKLCIPLHNLTNEDYEIPLSEGLIWVEFTKTTSIPTAGQPPSNSGFWEIKKFITKASEQYSDKLYDHKCILNGPISIRSSIPDMVQESEKKASKASNDAKNASQSAEKALENVKKTRVAAIEAKEAAEKTRSLGVYATLIAIIGVVGLWYTFFSDVRRQYDNVRPRIEKLESKISNYFDAIEVPTKTKTKTNTIVIDTSAKLKDSLARIEELENQNTRQEKENKELRERMDELERQIQRQQSVPSESNITSQ